MNKRKVPKIRFKGFYDDWEQRKLNEITDVRDGTHDSPKYVQEGHPFITSKNVSNGFINYDDVQYVTDEDYEKINKRSKVDIHDILMGMIGTIGNLALIRRNPDFAIKNVALIKHTGDIDCQYLYQVLQADCVTSQLSTGMDGGTQKFVSLKKIRELDIPFPEELEQQQIGTYFSILDNLNTLHQRKLEKLKIIKKSMLENCFPKNGKKVPKTRFSGFSDDWEQRKLGEIYGLIGNAFVGTATPYYVEQGHFYLESNNVKDGQINHNSEIFINDEFYEKQKDKWLHTGDMVMVQSGHVGHAAVIPEVMDNTAAHALIMFRNPKEKIEPYFLNFEYQTNKSKKKIENITTGNTIKHILASDMQEFEVDVPKYEEQEAIAGYFSNLDHLITLHQSKLEKLKMIKKSMLETMFV